MPLEIETNKLMLMSRIIHQWLLIEIQGKVEDKDQVKDKLLEVMETQVI
jgi:hypothetical protein